MGVKIRHSSASSAARDASARALMPGIATSLINAGLEGAGGPNTGSSTLTKEGRSSEDTAAPGASSIAATRSTVTAAPHRLLAMAAGRLAAADHLLGSLARHADCVSVGRLLRCIPSEFAAGRLRSGESAHDDGREGGRTANAGSQSLCRGLQAVCEETNIIWERRHPAPTLFLTVRSGVTADASLGARTERRAASRRGRGRGDS
jgi:hypothetical protein